MTYMSPDEIAAALFSELKPQAKTNILGACEKAEDMIQFHHGVGTDVRNRYDLWDQHNPYTMLELNKLSSEFEKASSPFHPDQVSHAILMKVWDKVTEEANA